MGLRQRIVTEIYDEKDNKIVDREIINDKPIKKPESILAKETISSMQAGLIFGQIGQTEYIVKNMIKESGLKDVKVVATGGLGKIIANETKYIQYYNPTLTLEGMRLIYAKQKR